MLETLDYTMRIGSTPTFLYFDLYLYAAHYVYVKKNIVCFGDQNIYQETQVCCCFQICK